MVSSGSLLTRDELLAYLDRINFPYLSPSSPNVPAPTMENLRTLVTHHLQAVPFENLTIHYSAHHTIDISPQALYNKIVINGHGGFCYENNTLFSLMLRSLGYKLWTGNASVLIDRTWGKDENGQHVIERQEKTHMVIFVELPLESEDTKGEDVLWYVDVGFGGNNVTAPKRLVEGEITQGVGPEQYQFSRVRLAGEEEPLYWLLEHRYNSDSPWEPNLVFGLEEGQEAYYREMSIKVSTDKDSIFTKNLMMIRINMDTNGVFTRVILFNDTLKVRKDGDTSLVQQFETEGQRVKAIDEWFGIKLSKEEVNGMRGRIVALKN